MTAQEIIQYLEDNIPKHSFEYTDIIKNKKIGPSKIVDEYSVEYGGEVACIRYFEEHNVYIMLRGFYESNNGTDYDGYNYEEVFPLKKDILIWSSSKEELQQVYFPKEKEDEKGIIELILSNNISDRQLVIEILKLNKNE